MEPPLITLIKSKNDEKLDNYHVKNKLRRDPTSGNSDLYELKTALFDNGNPEELLLFVWNFQMTLEESETINYGANIWYLCTLVRGRALRQLDTLSVEMGSTTTDH